MVPYVPQTLMNFGPEMAEITFILFIQPLVALVQLKHEYLRNKMHHKEMAKRF